MRRLHDHNCDSLVIYRVLIVSRPLFPDILYVTFAQVGRVSSRVVRQRVQLRVQVKTKIM